ncbi:MAG: putative sarcosine oxidase subunit beta [uncultured Thermomicrobiales bacterium]|uniref:Putative sarcosine oxidase subunit beta n=1 Tax=uncultured Thermomicrobiales bacterium TaxID=1645740 RepID=A0A6J4TCA8_9BACT|nr:MAG: putative sarcosine oxidase subunit beta [uncultured Thermomicrobiales bacterium]
MHTTAEVVIVGAGIMGCAIAHELAVQGLTDVLVLERDAVGRGATADAAGGIRQQFSTETNVRLAAHSVRVWETFADRFGSEIGLRQQGYLFLLTEPEQEPVFRANLALQQRLGVPARWVTPDEIAMLNPHVELGDVVGGTVCPEDGWVDTYQATMGYARAARRLGVAIEEDCAVVGIAVEGGRVTSVTTADGIRVATPLVILCAGPQTRQVGALAGVDLPIDPSRRMSFVTEPFDALPPDLPMTIEFASGLYFHPESGGFLFGMGNPDEAPGFDKTVDDAWMMTTVERLVQRAPAFADANIRTGWAGFYEITPDDNPLLGFVGEPAGLAVAAGFSGHGFMQGPAIGACIAELVLGGAATTVDITPFRPSRFREGALAQEHNVI